MKPPRSHVTRRDLMRLPPRDAGPAARVAGGVHRQRGSAASDLLKAARPLMGTSFEVRLPLAVPGALDLADRVLDRIEALETQLTIYRDDSELSRLNATAHLGPVAVERGLFDLLQLALAIGRETDGAYDVASGALSLAWGFVRGPRRVPDADALERARQASGSAHVRLDADAQTVTFDREGITLNLGSIGKGHAVDQAAAIVRRHPWPTSALIHGGQSSLFALGSPPWSFGGRWEVTLQNPLDAANPLGTFRLRNRGLGTSGAAFQRFESGGRLYGHILDPRTGEPPATGPLSVTVLAPTAAEADALSTACYLLGPEAAANLIARRPGVSVVFVVEHAGRPRLLTAGLGGSDFEPALGTHAFALD